MIIKKTGIAVLHYTMFGKRQTRVNFSTSTKHHSEETPVQKRPLYYDLLYSSD